MTKQTRPYATIDVPSAGAGLDSVWCARIANQTRPYATFDGPSIRAGFGFCLVCLHCQPNPPLRDHRRFILTGGFRYCQEVLA